MNSQFDLFPGPFQRKAASKVTSESKMLRIEKAFATLDMLHEDNAFIDLEYSDEQLLAEQKAWYPSDKEIVFLHERCLIENLSFLYFKHKKPWVNEEKYEIIEWIFATDVIGGKSVREIPFSFVNCCIACGVRAEEFRAQILSLPEIRKFLVDMHFCRESKLSPLTKKLFQSSASSSTVDPAVEVVQFLVHKQHKQPEDIFFD
jgi:hypothetical protein